MGRVFVCVVIDFGVYFIINFCNVGGRFCCIVIILLFLICYYRCYVVVGSGFSVICYSLFFKSELKLMWKWLYFYVKIENVY